MKNRKVFVTDGAGFIDRNLTRRLLKEVNPINSTNRVNSINHVNSTNSRILFLPNLIRTKGFIDVIQAIPEVIKNYKKVEFVFAGEWRVSRSEEQEIHQFINQNRLNSAIKFPGVTIGNKKKELLLSSDIFVFPTYYPYEGQPWVIIEAMVAGLPIITTDTGTIKEMVIDGDNGFIVEKKNP